MSNTSNIIDGKTCSNLVTSGFIASNQMNNVRDLENIFTTCDELATNRSFFDVWWANDLNTYSTNRENKYNPLMAQACDADIDSFIQQLKKEASMNPNMEELTLPMVRSHFTKCIDLFGLLSNDLKNQYSHFKSFYALRLYILGKARDEFDHTSEQYKLFNNWLISSSSGISGGGFGRSPDSILALILLGCVFYYFFMRPYSASSKQKRKKPQKSRRDVGTQSALRFLREGLRTLRS